jgi:hypothetical protein
MALAAILFALPALGQSSKEERDAAQLFREGRAALDRGDYAAACPKLAESLRLLRRSGTLFNLALCEAKQGHLIRAHKLVEEGIALLPKGDERQGPSKKQAEELDQRIPRVTLSIPPGATVEVDGDAIDPRTAGALRLDPGRHEIVVTAPGHAEQRSALELRERERRDLPLSLGRSLTPDAPVAKESPTDGRRVAAFVLGGLGIGSLGVGVAAGILTIGKKNEVEQNCRDGCNDAARAAATSGKTFSTLSTIAFVAGLAGIGAGTVLLLVSRGGRRSTTAVIAPDVLPGGGGVTLVGRY